MSTGMLRTLDEADVRGKRVLVRVDLNVPVENGKVADTTRIERVAPTIREIADKGGKVILLSHFGRPKGPDPAQSLLMVGAFFRSWQRQTNLWRERTKSRTGSERPHSALRCGLFPQRRASGPRPGTYLPVWPGSLPWQP